MSYGTRIKNDRILIGGSCMNNIYLVPSLRESNNWMYCNYARMNPHEERCLNCDKKDCKHNGKHTIIESR